MQAMDEYLQTGNDPVNTSGMGTAADTVLPALTLPGPLGRSTSAAVPTPQREPQKPVAHPIVVGTGVQAAKLLVAPKPAYPPLARAARVQGTVRLRALVATTGEIKNLQLISGPPLLVSAAYNAVTQWRYKPTLLNGEPVEVMTEIDVNFTLSQ
jgi:protein TonB